MTVFEIAKYRVRLIGTNSETVHLGDSQFIFIDSEILLTIGFFRFGMPSEPSVP